VFQPRRMRREAGMNTAHIAVPGRWKTTCSAVAAEKSC